MKKAIFLDRDGTLNLDKGYVHKVEDFQFFKGAIESLKKLQEAGYLLVLVTNQSGIARGYFEETDFIQLTEWMDWSLADRGVNFDGIYYCPHHIDGKDPQYAIECDCRKPQIGMFVTAQDELKIDMSQSIMVGDKYDDMHAAYKAGVGSRFLISWAEQVNYNSKIVENVLPQTSDNNHSEKLITGHISTLDDLVKWLNI